MTKEEVKNGLEIIRKVVTVVAFFSPKARKLAPLIGALLSALEEDFTQSVESGKIIPDGRGGWVPKVNSKFDPKTGRFL